MVMEWWSIFTKDKMTFWYVQSFKSLFLPLNVVCYTISYNLVILSYTTFPYIKSNASVAHMGLVDESWLFGEKN